MRAADLAMLDEVAPDPDVQRLLAERRELIRMCAERTVDIARRGLVVDPVYLDQCEALLRRTPRLEEPLSTGDPCARAFSPEASA